MTGAKVSTRFKANGHLQADAEYAVTRPALIKISAKLATFAALRCPVGTEDHDGPHTRDTIAASIQPGPSGPMGVVQGRGATIWVDKGTRAWTTDKVVHFVKDGQDVFVAPGYEFPARSPRPFMRDALRADLPGWIRGGGGA
jgi:hypothetical protein